MIRLILTIFTLGTLAFSGSGCASYKYAKTPAGKFGGVLQVEWVGPDKFIYRPHPDRPLYFKRANGEVIQPEKMFTDGGSIPRPLWIFKNYSPWGYAPGFIIHDWLFDAKHCGATAAKGHTVYTAADVLAECIKTLMETRSDEIPKDPLTLYLIDQAVRTKIAKGLWDNGTCAVPPDDGDLKIFSGNRDRWVQTFDFDAQR